VPFFEVLRGDEDGLLFAALKLAENGPLGQKLPPAIRPRSRLFCAPGILPGFRAMNLGE
jgi:hypothetical protein